MQINNSAQYHKKYLPKSEKLKSRKTIKILFAEGILNKQDCIKALFIELESIDAPQVLFSVPKSKIQKASIRNTIKRRMREAYRINKNILLPESTPKGIAIAFIFMQKSECKYSIIENKIVKHLKWINKTIIK